MSEALRLDNLSCITGYELAISQSCLNIINGERKWTAQDLFGGDLC
jgi:hypothetical protein